MLFDDDFIRLLLEHGQIDQPAKRLGITDWPPPEELEVAGFKFRRVRYSQLTDDQRKDMSQVIRGAEYKVVLP